MKIYILLFTLLLSSQLTCKNITATYTFRYEIFPSGKVNKLELTCLIPRDIPGIQKVKNIHFSIEPTKEWQSNNNQYVIFNFKNLEQPIDFYITADIEIYKPKPKSRFEDASIYNLTSPYLADEKFIEKNQPNIAEKAKELKKDDEIATIKNIFKFVKKHINYTLNLQNELGASVALNTLKGDCTEYSDLFIALCRANNIPARHIIGAITEYTTTPLHSWTEVYTKRYGWLRVDPTPNHSKSIFNTSNKYIQFCSGLHNNTLQYKSFYTYKCWGSSAKILLSM